MCVADQGCTYNRKTGQLTGIVGDSPLAGVLLAQSANAKAGTDPWSAFAPSLGTHATTYMFASSCGKLAAPIGTFPCVDKTMTKQFDLVHDCLEVIANLAGAGFSVLGVIADQHASNVVRLSLLLLYVGCSVVYI